MSRMYYLSSSSQLTDDKSGESSQEVSYTINLDPDYGENILTSPTSEIYSEYQNIGMKGLIEKSDSSGVTGSIISEANASMNGKTYYRAY